MSANLALFLIRARQRVKASEELKHTTIISAALIDFHKSQCYFTSAIAVASIVLSTAMASYDSSLSFQNFMVVIPLALNGCVPVVSTLQMISRYARLSWHTISLTMMSLLLSTIALAEANNVWGIWSLSISPDANGGKTERMARLVCGSQAIILNNLDSDVIDFTFVWLIHSFCVMSFPACVTDYVLRNTKRGIRISCSMRKSR